MTDTEADSHLTDTELYSVLTSAVSDTWDKIISAGRGDHYVKSVTFNTVANQTDYLISTVVSAGDFYKVSRLLVDEGNGQFRPLTRINGQEIQSYRGPTAVIPMKLYYAPCAPVWTLGSESFDGINGWEEHVLAVAAMAVKKKKQDDYAPFRQLKADLEKRMSLGASRDDGEPPRVVRKAYSRRNDYYAAFRANVSWYDVTGLNIQLFYNSGYLI